MLRAVVDPGVIISALISPRGTPAALVRRWLDGSVQFIWSPALIEEFESVCRRPRFRQWFSPDEAASIAEVIRSAGEFSPDSATSTLPPPDDGDLYLVELAVATHADCLVTGDADLLSHPVPGVRVVSPRQLLNVLDALDDRT